MEIKTSSAVETAQLNFITKRNSYGLLSEISETIRRADKLLSATFRFRSTEVVNKIRKRRTANLKGREVNLRIRVSQCECGKKQRLIAR